MASWQDTAQSMTRETLGISKNIKEIYDKNEDQVEAKAAPPTINEFAAASPAVVAAPIAVTGLKKPLDEVPPSKDIKYLIGGKSTLQNELLGCTEAEFGPAPDKAEEMSLGKLGAALQPSYIGTIGKQMRPGRTEGALMMALTMEPAKLLGSQTEFQQSQDAFVPQQLEVLLRHLKRNSRDGHRPHDISIRKSYGANYLQQILRTGPCCLPMLDSHQIFKKQPDHVLHCQATIYLSRRLIIKTTFINDCGRNNYLPNNPLLRISSMPFTNKAAP
ncbi:hypothetical protein PCANC_25084 [Puccinia coronata f. sp. avenae]|nr:hypothetical protein PCANC_25084 [Puccinia coronata f. sp. avenae]